MAKNNGAEAGGVDCGGVGGVKRQLEILTHRYNTLMYTLLRRTDETEHIDRWYMVAVQPSLLDKTAVICAYGNRQTEWQQLYVIPAESQEAALAQAQVIVKQKLRRGYQPIIE